MHVTAPNGTTFLYQGEGEASFFYFALSATDSLNQDPYNQPVAFLQGSPIRAFSVTLPYHGEGLKEALAMRAWAEAIERGEHPLEEFLDKTEEALLWLIKEGIINPAKMVLGGLSRGGFIATQLAARIKSCTYLLAFSPLTYFNTLEEFEKRMEPTFEARVERLNLIHLVSSLTHLKKVRFYIGNRDTRVHTDQCYRFIRALVEEAHAQRLRDMEVELFLTPSVGFKGHGTLPTIFQEGCNFVKKVVL